MRDGLFILKQPDKCVPNRCCEFVGLGGIGWRESAYGLSLVSGGHVAEPAQRVGRLILVRTVPTTSGAGGVVLYARVSSHDQRADLDRQVARLTGWATDQDLTVSPGRHRGRVGG
jgi:Resolvase, N terminal domain